MAKHIPEKVEFTNLIAIYNQQSKQLVVENRLNPNFSGLTLPGGHVEREESFSHAAIREAKEESGLTIKDPILKGIKDFEKDDATGRYVVLLYLATNFTGELFSSSEGQVFWEDLDKLQNTPNGVFQLDRMLQIIFSESLSELFYSDETTHLY
ncbi:hypothetical protein OAL24_00504 [Oenococcus sicerae]|nr:hypothetical protein OAL24_00504 [Oenococcus sicerae]